MSFGQICMSLDLVLVTKDITEKFTQMLADHVRNNYSAGADYTATVSVA
jgi:acyl-CoA reductase-like NAD-dependent aldehyde dehydrogenase